MHSQMNVTTPRRLSRIQSFLYGLTLPLLSFKTIARAPALLFWSIFPVVLTLGLYFWILQGLQSWGSEQIILFLGWLGTLWGFSPQGAISTIVQIFSSIVLFLVAALTFSFAASIVSSPFNDFLSEKAESHAQPPLAPAPDIPFRRKLRLVFIDLAKTVAAGIAAVAALIFSWVPILNLVGFTLAFLLLAFQFLSYPQTRREISLARSLLFLWTHFYSALGFGFSLSLLFAVPLLGAFIVPIAVVGGTLLFARATHSLR